MKIELQALEHAYPGGDKALDGVDLTLDGNEPVAIIGQNGAGKTTLVKHFNGILRPTGGKVLIDGIDVNERSTAEWSRSVGYVFQNPDDQLFLESVRKEFEFGPRQIGMGDQDIAHRVDSIAELVGLTKKLDVHPFDLTPTECGQDASGNAHLARIIERLKAQGRLCITISHDMKFVTANFSHVIVMYHGRVLLDGQTREVFAQTDTLRRSFVTPPPVTRVAQGAGLKETVFSVPAFINAIAQERNHRG